MVLPTDIIWILTEKKKGKIRRTKRLKKKGYFSRVHGERSGLIRGRVRVLVGT